MYGLVLAAGFGRRLEHITDHIPKPMIKINDIALIDHAINNLIKIGVRHILINTHYKFLTLQDFISQQLVKKKYGNVIIHFLYEKEILETGGAILSAMRLFNIDEIIVINSDIIIPQSDLSPLLAEWNDKTDVLGMLYDKQKLGYQVEGDFDLSKQKHLVPHKGGQYIWMGAYRVRRSIFTEYLEKPDMRFSVMNIIFKNHKKKYYGHLYQGVWIDLAGILEREYKLKQDKWGQISAVELAPGATIGSRLTTSLEEFCGVVEEDIV